MFWIVPLILRLVAMVKGSNAATHPVRRPEIENALDRAELLALTGEGENAHLALQSVRDPIESMQGTDGSALRVRWRTILAEIMHSGGRTDIARAALAEARTLMDGIADPDLKDSLDARLGAQTLICTPGEEVNDQVLAGASRAFELEPKVRRPEVRLRLVWAAHWMGQVLHQRGDWPRARASLERAVSYAEKLEPPGEAVTDASWDAHARAQFWTFGRRSASAAARQIAEVAVTLGDRETANAWYARSVSLLDGAKLVPARIARVQALAMRAMGDSVDEIEASAVRLVRLEQALAEASAITEPSGYAIASQIEREVAALHAGMGDTETSQLHLERAVEFAKQGGLEAVPYLVQARLVLAMHHENECENGRARDLLEGIWTEFASHHDPGLRYLASIAGANLHRLLDEPGDVERSAKLLPDLEAVVPGLAPPQRGPLLARLCRGRGVQLRREEHPQEAAAKLREAITLAGRVESEERHTLTQQAEMQLAMLLVDGGALAEADEHFSAALGVPESPGDGASPIGRANILLHRAKNRCDLDRAREAVQDLRRARDLGRDSGSAAGRVTAALASMALGDLETDSDTEKKQYYETAARLGKLSGRPRGLEVAEEAVRRQKECMD